MMIIKGNTVAPHGPASVQGTGNPGRERKGSWEKSLDPRGKAGLGGWPKKWLGTFRQTGCREEAEAEGKVGRAGQVGRGSSEEHRSCAQVDGDRGPRLPCTLQVLHRHRAGLQPCLSQVRHNPLVISP